MTQWRLTPTTNAALGLALLSLAFIGDPAKAANTIVYRCLDAHLNVVYTDLPCKDGQAFDTRAGEADPAALARLERLRDALDQSTVQRLSVDRLVAERTIVAPVRAEAEPENVSDYGDYYYTYPVAGYAPVRPHPPRQRIHRHAGVRGGAPPPPYIVPRP